VRPFTFLLINSITRLSWTTSHHGGYGTYDKENSLWRRANGLRYSKVAELVPTMHCVAAGRLSTMHLLARAGYSNHGTVHAASYAANFS
jgi:hypothetical protein